MSFQNDSNAEMRVAFNEYSGGMVSVESSLKTVIIDKLVQIFPVFECKHKLLSGIRQYVFTNQHMNNVWRCTALVVLYLEPYTPVFESHREIFKLGIIEAVKQKYLDMAETQNASFIAAIENTEILFVPMPELMASLPIHHSHFIGVSQQEVNCAKAKMRRHLFHGYRILRYESCLKDEVHFDEEKGTPKKWWRNSDCKKNLIKIIYLHLFGVEFVDSSAP